MQLKCKVCGEREQIDRTVRKGFADIAYDEIIQWSDFYDNPPPLEETHWTRSNILPKIGEYRLVKVEFPFSFDIGEQFNALFTPAMSFFDGWEEYPEEIEQSAVVSCKLERVAAQNEYSAWISVKILKVIMFSDMYKVYPVIATRKALEAFDFPERINHFTYKNWSYYSYSVQGDLGEWKLVFTDDAGIRHLVLMGVWDFHTHNIYCGNIINERTGATDGENEMQSEKRYEYGKKD